MDLSNFNLSKDSLPVLAITVVVIGFISSYIFSFIGKIIRFLALILAGIFLILYYSGHDINSKSVQNFIQDVKSHITKLISKFMENTTK